MSEEIKKQPTTIDKFFQRIFRRVPFVHKMLFIYHLQTMVKAGLSIIEALKILSAETENKKLKNVIGEVKIGVEKGQQLSEVLSAYPKIFPEIYVHMIAAGETAGKMEESLEQVYTQMKQSHELTSRIRGAMIYPAVILIAIGGISLEMVIFVLPKIMVMFKDFNATLPLPTRMLMAFMSFIQSYGIIMIVVIIAFIVGFIYAMKKLSFKRKVHSLMLKTFILGPILKQINLARFTLTLSSLLQSTIPIIDAVKICADVQSNIIYKESLMVVSDELKKGDSLSSLLAKYPKIYPPMVTEMIMVGEQSGQVEKMLKELSDYYTNEVNGIMKNFSTIIEPVIIVILGLVVAGIAVAVIMPMYSLAEQF